MPGTLHGAAIVPLRESLRERMEAEQILDALAARMRELDKRAGNFRVLFDKTDPHKLALYHRKLATRSAVGGFTRKAVTELARLASTIEAQHTAFVFSGGPDDEQEREALHAEFRFSLEQLALGANLVPGTGSEA